MFYSHEILTNTQYGVATIWLVATVGKGTQKKLTRKAIQGVDVPRACEKILDPGAPLSLRLQASLLYGVSRVFSQQCNYVLADAEKTQTEMVSYFRSMQQSETDPQAGKTKRHNITLGNDPSFDPLAALPQLDLLKWDASQILQGSNSSSNQYSHLTPLASQAGSSVRRADSRFSINLPDSSHSARSYHIPSDFGQQSPSGFKPFHQGPIEDMNPFEEDGCAGGVIGLEIDADGNILDFLENEPGLPPLPGPDGIDVGVEYERHNTPGNMRNPLTNNQEALFLGDEEVLPDAEAFPIRATSRDRIPSSTPSLEPSSPEEKVARNLQRRHRKASAMVDASDHVSRAEFRQWVEGYLDNMESAVKPPAKTTVAQAKKNAWALMFDNGISNVGRRMDTNTQIAHPLAESFAGDHLARALLGTDFVEKLPVKARQTRRRKRSEAFTEEEAANNEGERPSKRSNNEEVEVVLHDDPFVFGDELAPELGMDAAAPLSDRHSSTIMPWSRQGSVIPMSSVRGSAQKADHGSIIHPIERYSDALGFDSDNHGAQMPIQVT